MAFRRGRNDPASGRTAPANALYVYLAQDGAIFVARDGRTAWVTRVQLQEELRSLRASAGTLLYGREHPDAAPSPLAEDTFTAVIEHRLPIQLVEEVHPAIVPLPDNMTYLMAFASNDMVGLLEDLLARGVGTDCRDANGRTALMHAALRGCDHSVKLLLARGAATDTPDVGGVAPLIAAVRDGHIDVARQLLEAGADPNAPGDVANGYTALVRAIHQKHDDCVQLLLDYDADVDLSDIDGSTPLMFAANRGADEVLKQLIDAGADRNVRGHHGLTALGFALQNRHTSSARILIDAGSHE